MNVDEIRKHIERTEEMGQAAAANTRDRLDWLQALASWEIALQLAIQNEQDIEID